MIRSRLGHGEDVALEHNPSKHSPHPLCTVSWAKANVEPVPGVGDKAIWVPKMRQLSFVSGNRLLHLTVNTGDDLDGELTMARSLADDVIAAL